MKVFISHSHSDKPIADAWKKLLKVLFDDNIEVAYSSDDTPGNGIDPGENWLEWIKEHVQTSTHTLVVLTPESLDKPWLMWESGAAAGVAMGTGTRTSVVPILYRTAFEAIPAPLRSTQAIGGEVENDIRRLVGILNESLGHVLAPAIFDLACRTAIPEYLKSIPQPAERQEVRPLDSGYAIADIRIDLNSQHSQQERAKRSIFTASSVAADQLFHVGDWNPPVRSLVGQGIYEAFKYLENYCDVDQWRAVQDEQDRLAFHLLKGEPLPAKRPMIFLSGPAAEEKRVDETLRGRAFLPLIVQHGFHDSVLELRMLYYEVPTRPRRYGRHVEVDLGSIDDLTAAVAVAAQAETPAAVGNGSPRVPR